MKLHCCEILFKTLPENKQTDASFWLFCFDPICFSNKENQIGGNVMNQGCKILEKWSV